MQGQVVPARAAIERIAADAAAVGHRATLVALSGIHAAGKGRLATCVVAGLVERGLRIALVSVAPWSRPRSGFRGPDAVERYRRDAIRWDALFTTMVEPLRRGRAISLRTRLLESGRDRWYLHGYDFAAVDVILLVGIFLLRPDLRDRYDSAWWVDATFDAAMRRAIGRSRAERDPDAIVGDYQRLYFPAQRLHLQADDPAAAATGVIRPPAEVTPLLRCSGRLH